MTVISDVLNFLFGFDLLPEHVAAVTLVLVQAILIVLLALLGTSFVLKVYDSAMAVFLRRRQSFLGEEWGGSLSLFAIEAGYILIVLPLLLDALTYSIVFLLR